MNSAQRELVHWLVRQGGCPGFIGDDLYDNLDKVGRALTYIAIDRGMPLPTTYLGSGGFGVVFATTHPRQVIKVSYMPHELLSCLALLIARHDVPKRVRTSMTGTVDAAILRWDPKSNEPLCGVLWRERLPIAEHDMVHPDDPKQFLQLPRSIRSYLWDELGNVGLRGRRKQTVVAFDGHLKRETSRNILIPKAAEAAERTLVDA